MTRWLATAVVATALLAGCGGADAVSDAVTDVASDAEEKVELARYCVAALDLVQAIDDRDADAAVDAGERLVEHAPDAIRADAETVLAAAEEARGGDLEALQRQEVQRSAEAVRTFTTENCDPQGG